MEQLLSGPLRCSTASEAPGLGPKLDSRLLRFLKVDLEVVPQICSEQAEDGLREGILSSPEAWLLAKKERSEGEKLNGNKAWWERRPRLADTQSRFHRLG